MKGWRDVLRSPGWFARFMLAALTLPTLKSAPRGYARDHPRISLLRRKGLVASRSLTDDALRDGDRVRDFVVETFAGCEPLVGWLGKHVGPPAKRNEPPR